jgi:hypothetical protein
VGETVNTPSGMRVTVDAAMRARDVSRAIEEPASAEQPEPASAALDKPKPPLSESPGLGKSARRRLSKRQARTTRQ